MSYEKDEVLDFILCMNRHIKEVIGLRIKYKSKFRVKRELLYVREDINKAIRLINNELKEEGDNINDF